MDRYIHRLKKRRRITPELTNHKNKVGQSAVKHRETRLFIAGSEAGTNRLITEEITSSLPRKLRPFEL